MNMHDNDEVFNIEDNTILVNSEIEEEKKRQNLLLKIKANLLSTIKEIDRELYKNDINEQKKNR